MILRTQFNPHCELPPLALSVLADLIRGRAGPILPPAMPVGTFSSHQHCLRAMSATLDKQFEGFAECCVELARSAETTARRARFIQMAHEYQLATLLIREELSSDLGGREECMAGAPTYLPALRAS